MPLSPLPLLLTFLCLLPPSLALQLQHPTQLESGTRILITSPTSSTTTYFSEYFRVESVSSSTRVMALGIDKLSTNTINYQKIDLQLRSIFNQYFYLKLTIFSTISISSLNVRYLSSEATETNLFSASSYLTIPNGDALRQGYGHRTKTVSLQVPISFNTTNLMVLPFLQGHFFISVDHILYLNPSTTTPFDSSNFNQELLISVDGDTVVKQVRFNVLFVNADNFRSTGYYVQGGPDTVILDNYYINSAGLAIEYYRNTSLVSGYSGLTTAENRDLSLGITLDISGLGLTFNKFNIDKISFSFLQIGFIVSNSSNGTIPNPATNVNQVPSTSTTTTTTSTNTSTNTNTTSTNTSTNTSTGTNTTTNTTSNTTTNTSTNPNPTSTTNQTNDSSSQTSIMSILPYLLTIGIFALAILIIVIIVVIKCQLKPEGEVFVGGRPVTGFGNHRRVGSSEQQSAASVHNLYNQERPLKLPRINIVPDKQLPLKMTD